MLIIALQIAHHVECLLIVTYGGFSDVTLKQMEQVSIQRLETLIPQKLVFNLQLIHRSFELLEHAYSLQEHESLLVALISTL